jgi:4-amino-4-deoxy-L-arabinose transferase-like glycosyltransferase
MKKISIILSIVLVLICIVFNLKISKRYFTEKVGTPGSDPVLYNSIAMAILNGNSSFQWGNHKVDIGREVTPFYSGLVALSYFVGGVHSYSPYILNVILNCLTIYLLFLTIILITKRITISFLFSLIFIFYFPLWRMNYLIMMEVTTVFFLSASIYLLGLYYYNYKNRYLYSSMFVFSLLCLINNRFIILFIALFAALFFHAVIKKMNIRKKLLIPFLITLLTISPWFIRQIIVYKQFVFFTPLWNNAASNQIGIFKRINIETASDDESINRPLDYDSYIKELRTYNTGDLQQTRVSAFTTEKYMEIIRKHNSHENTFIAGFKNYFTLYYTDFRFMSTNDFRLIAPSSRAYKMVQMIILFPLLLLSVIGTFLAFKNKELLVILLGSLFLTHLVLHAVWGFIDRYRLTVLPIVLLIATYGFSEIFVMYKKTVHGFKVKSILEVNK